MNEILSTPAIPAAAGFTPMVLAHTAAALLAIGVGAVAFAARKGTLAHRIAGRAWVALMLAAAISSFWIQGLGHFSPIHLLSIAVPVMLGAAVWCAMTGRIERHRQMMTRLYLFGLGVAGLFTLLPGRLLGRVLWTSLGII